MKNIKNTFYIGLLVLSTICFVACSDEVSYDFPGDAFNRVYLNDNTSSYYKIIQTPISSISDLKFETYLKCTKKATGNIKATVEVDNSMIAAYNEENGTNYEEMPSSALLIKNAIMKIPSGKMVSVDTLSITISEDDGVISTLKSQNGYLIPLRLTKSEGGNSQVSSNVSFTYLIVTVTEDNVNHEAIKSDIRGILETNQTGWSASTNGTVRSYYDPIEALFDGDMTTYCEIISREDLRLDINMGKQYTFDALELYYGSSSSWGSYEYGALTNRMTIYTSNDGVKWQSIGEINGATSRYSVFYAPITTQHIRLVIPKGNYDTYLSAGVFNIYVI